MDTDIPVLGDNLLEILADLRKDSLHVAKISRVEQRYNYYPSLGLQLNGERMRLPAGAGDNFKSWGERRIADVLERYRLEYVYEPALLVTDGGRQRIWYLDFGLPRYGVYTSILSGAAHLLPDMGQGHIPQYE